MSERLRSFVLVIITILVIAFTLLFQVAESLQHVGMYRFFLEFNFIMRNIWVPCFMSIFIYSLIRPFFILDSLYAGLIGRGAKPWFFAILLGILKFSSRNNLWTSFRYLYKSGVNIGTMWVFMISSYLLSLPVLLFILTLFGHYIFYMYFLVSIILIVFMGALGEIFQYTGIISPSNILIRKNPNIANIFIRLPWKILAWNGYGRNIWFYFKKVFRIFYLPLCIGMILSALLAAGIGNDMYRLVLGNHLIGQFVSVILTAILPLFRMAGVMLGYSMVHIHNGLGTMFTLMVSSFVWQFLYEGNDKRTYKRNFVALFIISIFITTMVAGYILNLYGL